MRLCGISNYSIYYNDSDGMLFNYLEINGDFDKSMEKLGAMDIAKKWWEYMDKYFIKNDSFKLGPDTEMIEEVFHMD